MDEACLNVGKTTDSMLLDAMDQKLKVLCFHVFFFTFLYSFFVLI